MHSHSQDRQGPAHALDSDVQNGSRAARVPTARTSIRVCVTMSLPKYLCYPARQRQAPLSLPCTRMRFAIGPVYMCINRPLPMNQLATMALTSSKTSPARCYNAYVFELASASVGSGLPSLRYPALIRLDRLTARYQLAQTTAAHVAKIFRGFQFLSQWNEWSFTVDMHVVELARGMAAVTAGVELGGQTLSERYYAGLRIHVYEVIVETWPA